MAKVHALVSFTRGEDSYEPGDEVEILTENEEDQANLDQLIRMGVVSQSMPPSTSSKRPPSKDIPKK